LRGFCIAVKSSLQPRQGYAKSEGMPTSSAADPTLPAPADAKSERPADTRPLPEAAVRALAEAAARRTERDNIQAEKSQAANEVGGRGGLDPTRYGDWEVSGIASDF
jgi:hypothetical protein